MLACDCCLKLLIYIKSVNVLIINAFTDCYFPMQSFYLPTQNVKY